MTRTCNNCDPNHSEEWCLSKELAKSNRRLRIVIAVVVALWLVTVIGFFVTSNNNGDNIEKATVSEQFSFAESDGIATHETEVS